MDYYRVLGVARDASDETIKRAYRALVKDVHPDSGESGSSERFRVVREAYETLSDPAKRRDYDRRGHSAPRSAPVSWTGGFDAPLAPFAEVTRSDLGPIHVEIELSPEEARRGGEVVVEVRVEGPCRRCAGRGEDFFGWCQGCGGSGWRRGYERVRFRLPPGVRSETIIAASGVYAERVRALVRLSR